MSISATRKLESFFSRFKKYHYKKGEIILRGGDTPYGVYFINKGYVKDYSISKDGEELILIIFKPGDFFPIIWAVNNTARTYYAEAMTSVEVWRAPREKFLEFITANPDVLLELTSKILIRFGGVLQRMEYLAFGNAYEKVASIVLICAERFGKKEGKNIVIQVPLTHKDIAELLGVTRETASIEMKKLEKKEIISYRSKFIRVKNLNRLRKESLFNGL